MIVVRVELWSAVTGKKTELATMTISNEGTGTAASGNYIGNTLHKVSKRVQRTGHVKNHARQTSHVWVLVRKMLEAMRY